MATFCFADTEDIEIQVALVLLAYRVSAAFGAPNNVVCEANVRHKSKSLFCGEDSLSYGVVPSRHIVVDPSIRALRTRLSSLRSVVPSRHLTPKPTHNACIRVIRGQKNNSRTKRLADK